jgi:predicted dehydrogenase
MEKLRVAVIGVGHLGERHAKTYREIQGAELIGVCDLNPGRLQEVSRSLGVPGFAQARELLGQVDAVSVCVPTNSHYATAAECLKHKIHTLVEKPITSTLKQADSLIKLARKNRLILQVGHIERFNPAFAATQRLIKEPKFIECHRLSPFPNRSLDVGVVLDLMIHDIDIVLGLVNSPIKRIEGVGVPVLTAFEDIANARLTFKNGCVANLTASRVSDEWMRKIRVFQADTYISLDYRQAQACVYQKNGAAISKTDLPIEKEESLQKELASFLACVRENKTPLVSGSMARDALAVALNIQNQICRKKLF